ncbi:MAG: transglycosylase SLT domain-containing protein [Neisseria sp.]|nr:transglycosylase SLT domain-containing protein [Neisseria sp.]
MTLFRKRLTWLCAAVLAACATSETPLPAGDADNRPAVSVAPQAKLPQRPAQSEEQVLKAFYVYENTLRAVKNGDEAAAASFLNMMPEGAMAEAVRTERLKNLAKNSDWAGFRREYAKLGEAGRSAEIRCYADMAEGNYQAAAERVRETGGLSAGCTRLVADAARQGRLKNDDVWRHVRGLMAAKRFTDARNLAAAAGSPLDGNEGRGAQENLLRDIVSKPSAVAAERLRGLEESGAIGREQAGFAWGILGLQQAKSRNFGTALAYYDKADRTQLNKDAFEWYARSALRFGKWNELASIISDMPAGLKNDPTWQYWLARSYAVQGRTKEAQELYRKAAQSGRNFYAVLSLEELGGRIDTRNNTPEPKAVDVARLAQDGAIARALVLYRNSLNGSVAMRKAAQAEWRYAVRSLDETAKITAAKLAYDNQFYEMAVNTAADTDKVLHYNLRYITPFAEQVQHYSAQAGIDTAWVYGLIRQESRFMLGAKSSVGAQGLMQVMPATAREIARKIGMDSSALYTTDGNIRMGTWYLGDAKRRLQNNEVMATAGYNAGPGRARQWQADVPLEGAVYAETIPFNETRDYVKKVMANATYYASLLNQPHTSLKRRMGTVPAK